MAGGIKKTEIVEADLNQLSNELRMVGDNILRIIEVSSKVKPITGLTELSKATKETSDNATELDRIGKKLALSEQRLKDLMDERTKAIIANNKATQEQTAEMKRQATIAKQVEGSYEQINASMNSNIIAYKKLSQAQRENEAIGGEMIKTIQAQDAQLKQLDATMGRSQRNVGNYKSGFNGLNFSIMQVGRELPSLAYGVNVFAAAISNNIPMVTDELKRAREEIVRATKAGEQSVPIWKQVGSAIFSWQTALVVGLTLFTLYGKEIIGFIGGLFKTTEAINRAKIAQEEFNKVRLEGISSAQSELTRLNLLWSAYKNVNTSQSDKLKIQEELQNKYPAYFKNLGDETFNVGLAEKGYYQLKNAILEAANARVFADEIAKTKGEIVTDLEPKLQKANDAITKFIDEHKISLAAELTSGYEGIPLSNIRLESLKKESKLVEQEILQRNAKIFKLNNEINPVALLQDFGVREDKVGKDSNKVKAAKEEAAELIDINFLLAKIKRDQEIEAQKEASEETKRLIKSATDEQKAFTDETVSNSMAQADEEKLFAQEVTIEKIRAAKNEKDEIEKIQHELTLFMIDQDIAAQQRILDTAGLEADAYANASERIRRLRLQRGEEEIQFTQQTEEQKKQIRNETMQATAELLSQGLAFSQQIYSAQATRAQEAYDAEMNAAGDSLEYQTLAKRKFEAEDKKIKQRQAIASKLQAVLDAGLALALAIATTWKNPFLAALNIGAATLGLGMALATPIPQFAEGTDFAPSSFIAGEEGSELIKTKSGKVILTPNKATLFSDNSLIGSSIIPHDQTQRMLANMAFNQVHDVVDMRDTNRHLSGIEKNTRNKELRYTDSKGRTVIKRGNLISTL